MKTLGIILLAFILTGCATKPVPVRMKFPQVPDSFLVNCPDLKTLEKDTKLSDVAKTVNENYMLYHECAVKNKAWSEWYQTQKKIFESIK